MTLFRTQNGEQKTTASNVQSIPFATLSTVSLGVDNDKKAICNTAKKLYERAKNEGKKLTWEHVFEFLLLNFKTEPNRPKIREELILNAKKYCPTYEKAIEVLNEQQL